MKYKIQIDRQTRAVMRDGIELAVVVVRPDSPGTYPAIMSYNPYRTLTAVKSTYSGQSVQTTFEFVIESSTPTPTIKSTTVKFENNVFNVETSVSNGNVKSIEVDKEFASLIITISTSGKEDGTFVFRRM